MIYFLVFAAGLIIGAVLGAFAIALLTAGKMADQTNERLMRKKTELICVCGHSKTYHSDCGICGFAMPTGGWCDCNNYQKMKG